MQLLVRAKSLGYYDEKRRRAGQKFSICEKAIKKDKKSGLFVLPKWVDVVQPIDYGKAKGGEERAKVVDKFLQGLLSAKPKGKSEDPPQIPPPQTVGDVEDEKPQEGQSSGDQDVI